MSEVVIEPAVFEDLDELSNLLGELFSEEKDFRPNKQKQLQGLRLIFEEPNRGRFRHVAGARSDLNDQIGVRRRDCVDDTTRNLIVSQEILPEALLRSNQLSQAAPRTEG